jgi:hypothetical protein
MSGLAECDRASRMARAVPLCGVRGDVKEGESRATQAIDTIFVIKKFGDLRLHQTRHLNPQGKLVKRTNRIWAIDLNRRNICNICNPECVCTLLIFSIESS